jgi:hypothetical protein
MQPQQEPVLEQLGNLGQRCLQQAGGRSGGDGRRPGHRRGWMGDHVVLGFGCEQSLERQPSYGTLTGVGETAVAFFVDSVIERAVVVGLFRYPRRYMSAVVKQPELHAINNGAEERCERYGQRPITIIHDGAEGADLDSRAAKDLLSIRP